MYAIEQYRYLNRPIIFLLKSVPAPKKCIPRSHQTHSRPLYYSKEFIIFE